jgi:hypothetical protein
MTIAVRAIPFQIGKIAILHFANLYSSLIHTYINTHTHTYVHTFIHTYYVNGKSTVKTQLYLLAMSGWIT